MNILINTNPPNGSIRHIQTLRPPCKRLWEGCVFIHRRLRRFLVSFSSICPVFQLYSICIDFPIVIDGFGLIHSAYWRDSEIRCRLVWINTQLSTGSCVAPQVSKSILYVYWEDLYWTEVKDGVYFFAVGDLFFFASGVFENVDFRRQKPEMSKSSMFLSLEDPDFE